MSNTFYVQGDPMNIYDFFNSPDVAEYCQSIGHKFNGLESAIMINRSTKRTLAEKHAAYRTIIEEYPDMEIPENSDRYYVKSLHKALEINIKHEELIVEKLLTPEPGAVYQALLWYVDEGSNYMTESLFSTYDEALADIKDTYEGDWFIKIHPNAKRSPAPLYVYIYKLIVNDSERITAKVSMSGEILEINSHGYVPLWEEHRAELKMLTSSYIDVPVPFKNGDIVEIAIDGSWNSEDEGVYVLDDICRNNQELHAYNLQNGDLSNMFASAYYYNEKDETIGSGSVRFYPDLRYRKRELYGKERILKYFSLYLQGELCISMLFKLHKYLLMDKKIWDLKNDYSFHHELSQMGDDLLKY